MPGLASNLVRRSMAYSITPGARDEIVTPSSGAINELFRVVMQNHSVWCCAAQLVVAFDHSDTT